MSWRKWLVRLVVFTATSLLGVGYVLYQRATNDVAVRELVLERLQHEFTGVAATLETAQLRLLGGIAITDLRLRRADDRDQVDFLHVPSAVMYHDKENALRRKRLRKIELYRPRLRVVRGADGHINLAGLLSPPDLTQPMPILVIKQGTILFEDRSAAAQAAPLELRNVNLTIVNDPVLRQTFEGTASSALVGSVRVRGSRERDSNRTHLALSLPAVPVGGPLIERLAVYSKDLGIHGRQLEGTGAVQAELAYDPGTAPTLTHDVTLRLTRGKFNHARIPAALHDVEASLRCVDGRIPEARVTARAGEARVEASVRDLTPGRGEALKDLVRELDLRVEHLSVDADTIHRLPENLEKDLKEIHEDFNPEGKLGLTFEFRRDDDGGWRKHCVVRPEGGRTSFVRFPYALEGITGTIDVDYRSDRPDRVTIDLAGRTGTRPIHIRGQLSGARPAAVAVDLWGEDIPLDDKLLAALPEKFRALANEFHPQGQGSFKAYIRRDQGSREFHNRFVVTFRDCKVRYDVFPYPLEHVHGVLDIQPGGWEFRDFRGTHNGGTFRTAGRATPSGEGDRVEIDLSGTDILLDRELAAALVEPELRTVWDVFAPTGRINFEGQVVKYTGRPAEIDVTVESKGCGIRPRFFPYALSDVRGKVHYRPDRWVEIDGVTARHRDSVLSLNRGHFYLKRGGGVWGELIDLEGKPLWPDADLQKALPPVLGKALAALNVRGAVGLKTNVTLDTPPEPGASPKVFWDGQVALQGTTLDAGVRLEGVTGEVACRGLHDGRQIDGVTGNLAVRQATVLKQPLRNLQGKFHVAREAPEVVRLPGLRGEWFGGEVYGPMRLEFGPTLRYEMRLSAANVQLQDFARQNLPPGVKVSGLASAELYLNGQGADLTGLSGGGTIDVPSGKMYNLPVLLDLLKVLGLRWPDKTAFEEGRAQFDIKGQRVNFTRLDLFGNAISLRGAGGMNLNGTGIDLVFHTEWARIAQVLPPGLKQMPGAISNQLLKIHMKGDVNGVKFDKEPMPALLEPMKKVFGGLKADGKARGAAPVEPGR